VPEAMDALGDALGGGEAATAVEVLRERAGLPSRLRDVGVIEDDLDAVARLSQGNPTVARNPRPVSEEDARAILAAAY
jgi:alcohol dehydrogenase class IV